MTEYAYTAFDAFCAENRRGFTAHTVHQFGLAVMLELRDRAPALVTEFALKRKQQIDSNTNEGKVLSWRLACWDFVGNREPECNVAVAFARAVICLLFPMADSKQCPDSLLDDFTIFMQMAGDFEPVMMAHRHLLLTP